MEEEEDFNDGLILPPLLIQLRKILDQYPDDSHILKELIQNAEDANAREIKFLFDRHTYGRDSRYLQHPNLTKYQGPALYTYNDGLFKDDDWKGVRMLSQSIKHDDPLKVGYFGMGFKSVFHLTDVPFILSGDKLAAIDPQQTCFQSSSFAWSLPRQGDMVTRLSHQVAPFIGKFNATEESFTKGFYSGTMFRFPLRMLPSKLCDTVYSTERMHRLLESFKEDAYMVMIFLMHIENVEFHEQDERSLTPRLTFRVKLSDACLHEVRHKRAEFMNQIKSNVIPDRPIVTTYHIEIETIDMKGNEEIIHRNSFLVTNYFSGSQVSAVFRKLYRDIDLRFPPWVGTALTLRSQSQENRHTEQLESSASDGHVFCFLPLPLEGNTATGLSVHVNGFFALEQNRKYIKMPGTFQTREDLMDKRLLWNQCMLKEVLPKAYSNMILNAIKLYSSEKSHVLISINDIYRAFPDFRKVDRQWGTILPVMYNELFQHKVVHAASNGGHWVEPRHAVFNTLEEQEKSSDVVIQILTAGNVNIANVPPHVLQAIQNCCRLLNGKITPMLVAQTYIKVQHNMSLPREDRAKVLDYFLRNGKYELLDGLELLPLASGGFTRFTLNARRAEKVIYIPGDTIPMDLLPGLEDDFLSTDVDDETKNLLIRALNKGYTQLKMLDAHTFASLLPRCLPSEWADQRRVVWRPKDPSHPPDTWLQAVWTYLVRCTPGDISSFENIPLVPLHGVNGDDIELVSLVAGGPLLTRELNEQSLPKGIHKLLEILSVIIIDGMPEYISIHPAVSKRYVHSPTYIGVLRAMGTITQGKGLSYLSDMVFESTTDEEKRTLREFFNKISKYELTEDITGVLACLPIFETVKLKDTPPRFVAFDNVNCAAPVEKLPVNLSQDVLDLMVPHTNNLTRVLGVRILTMADLLMEVVFPDIEAAFYDTSNVEKLMIFVLRHYFTFLEQNTSFQTSLQSLPFMPRKEVFLTAERFYDPDDQLLRRVFIGEENFPFGVYADPTIVTVLRQIGLRGVSAMEPEDLREACFKTEDMAQGRTTILHEKIELKSDAIMEYIEKHINILDAECDKKTLRECISDIGWVRRLSRKPAVYPMSLPWFTADAGYHKPCEMVQKIHSNVAGSVIPIVAKDCDKIGNKFGWLNPPGAEHLVKHLANAVNHFKGMDKAMYLEITRAVYSELSHYGTEDVRTLLEENKLINWVWNGDGFTSPQQIVFREPFMDLRPFVYTFPAELQPFSDFFGAFGARESCHLPNVLKLIKSKHDTAEVLHTNVTEVKKDLHLCVTILNELKSNVTDETLPPLQEELVLPLHTESNLYLKLAPLNECTYCDHEWMRQGYDIGSFSEEDDSLLLVHPNLPIVTSQILGVPTLMSRMLEAEELDFSFGQSDSLTHRLNVLLQEYVDGFAVPKELVQNADDAGATCVRFLYDERQNQDCRTCLIDEGMRECQGPALWVYNNAVFSDEDFDDITKLSGATKEGKSDQIGRFGLGFNAVYNLTDVPSFISRHNIVIFDPHTTHLGKSIKNKLKPGIKIDMHKHRRKLRRLENQFKPYNDVFGCDLRAEATQDVYNGTLFRLPLRTKAQAVKSEICKRHYDDSEVKALLMLLVHGAENLLLFTQNVVELSVYHLPAHGRTPSDANQIFTINKRSVRILKELLPVVPLSNLAKKLEDNKLDAVKQSGTLKAATKVISNIRSGMSPNDIVTPNAATVLSLEQKLTDPGSRLLRVKYFQKSRPWLVNSFMGYGESLQMALAEDNLIPIAGMAVPLEHHEASDCYLPVPIVDGDNNPCGIVFTYLPVPIHSGLPIHINGAFAVTSNRRHLVEQSDEDKYDVRAIWNEALLKDAMCQAYINMLKYLTIITPQPDYKFHTLWPNPQRIETSCQSLLMSFYKMVAGEDESAPTLLSDGMKWVNMHHTCSLADSLGQSGICQDALVVFRICCEDLPSIVTEVPSFVREGLEFAGMSDMLMKNSYNISRFFREIFLPNIASAPPQNRDHLMIQVLSTDLETGSELYQDIQQCDCIPTSHEGIQLRKPSDLVDPECNLAKMYSPHDSRFPHATYRSIEVLRSLRELGMATSDICWSELLSRAESVCELNQEHTRKRITALLDSIQIKLETEDNNVEEMLKYQPLFQAIAFLPVMKRPEHFPLQWKGEELGTNALVAPNQSYSTDHRSLAGCTEPIIDQTVFPHVSDNVRSFLGIDTRTPSLDITLEQMRIISQKETETLIKNKQVNNEIFKVCFNIYNYLESVSTDMEAGKHIAENLGDSHFLLCHDQFLSPTQVACEFSHTCAPYLFSLPEIYKRNFADLLNVVGVRQHFETKDFVQALQGMHDKHNDNILDKESIKLALQLVNLLNDSMQDLNQTLTNVVSDLGTIYIPDATCVLRASSELCFNEPDCQWVPTAGYVNYSHELIPFAISKQLGVNTKRQEVLKKHSRGIPFGQRERLPVRLKRILSSYPCDKEILKELLQNADDAGATEIHFIQDPRQHGTERVFDDSWKSLQGPALCVYNNRPFTDNDLTGIQRLGEGSKGTDPNKTGQYGVGFNCVYHLTDAPSFLTSVNAGQSLCIFDPQAKYVPGATVEEPGRRYDEVSELRKIFSDVFPCYLESHYDITNGTMFRFPLRTAAMAEDSELSEEAISLDMLESLFMKFKHEIFDCLLFVNNITSITLAEIDKRKGELVNAYTVQVEMSAEDRQTRKEFANYMAMISDRIQRGYVTLSQIETRSITYQMTIRDNKGYYERWMVTQKIGFNDGTDIPQVLNEVYRRQELALLPRGGVAALLDTSHSEVARRPKRAFCFLPLPMKTDLPVHINGHFALDHEARRNLWQDDDTGTKTEWNYMLLRKIIAPAYVTLLRRLPSYLDGTMMGLNLSIMDIFGSDVPSVDAFVDKLPRFINTNPYWISLVEGVYQHIHSSQATVLPVVRSTTAFFSLTRSQNSSEMNDTTNQVEVEWLSTSGECRSKPYFDNLDESFPEEDEMSISGSFLARRRLTSTPKKQGRREILRQVLLSSGLKLLRLPMEVYNCFMRANIQVACITPEKVTEFYGTYGDEETSCSIGTLPCDIGSTPFKNVTTLKTILEYCFRDDDAFFNNINGLPLLLCQDGQVRQFSEDDPVYLSPYQDLLPSLTAMFTHGSLARSIFKHVDVDSCPVFLRFDIPSFGSLLGNEIPEYAYKTESKHALWAADKDTLPSPRWIWMLWEFLTEELDRIMELQTEKVEKETLARQILRPVRKWCLLPTHLVNTGQQSRSQHYFGGELETTEQYLVPVGIATTTIDYTNASIMSYPVRECLRKLGVPEINNNILHGSEDIASIEDLHRSTSSSSLPHAIVASIEKPKTVLHCLHYVAANEWNSGDMRAEDCLIILKYFNDSIDEWRNNEEAISILRSLPLYFTVHGDITRIGKNEAYVLPTEIPNADMDAWERQRSIIFLRANPALKELYKTLGSAFLSVTEVYARFIFKNFEYLNPDARITHLKFIKDTKLPQLIAEEREVFVGHLKGLEFLEDEDGRLRQAFHFHDPYHPVYKVMLEGQQSVFPPAPFDEFKWLSFMKMIGLQHDLTPDKFVEFAQLVAAEAKEATPSENTFNKARSLVLHLFARNNVTCEELLERISDIQFIPATKPSKTLLKICPAHNRGVETSHIELNIYPDANDDTQIYISFKEGIPEGHEELVWTSCFLLPDWANPFKLTENNVNCNVENESGQIESFDNYQKEISRQLGVSIDPPIELVIQHAREVCSVKGPKNRHHDDFHGYMKMNVMKRVYKFLQEKTKHNDVARSTLKDTKCIAVDLGLTFVKPKQVVINLYEEDQIVPYLYKAPIELGEFKSLFLHLGATLNVTSDQYASVIESIYNTTTGTKLHPNEMTTAFKAVHELFTSLEKHPEESLSTEVLFLPSTSGRLVQSTELVFNDEPSYTDRIKKFDKPFLVDLSECKLKARNYEDLVKLLPNNLRPIMLTTLVKEVLETSADQCYDFGVTEKLKHQLTSKAFSNGVVRLIRHEHRRSGHKVKQAVIDSIQDELKRVHVSAIDRVHTYLTYQGVKIEGSYSEGDCFVDKVQQSGADIAGSWTIFITNSVSMNEELLVSVADVVNKIVGGVLSNSVHYLQPMLSCAPTSIYRVLDRLKIRPDYSVDIKAPTLPIPGSFIPIEDHHLLREDFAEFSQGEYIGLELDDDESGLQTFIYAIVEDKSIEEIRDEHGMSVLTQKYEICVGEDHKTITALATDMYKFHRVQRFVSRPNSMSEGSFNISNSSTSDFKKHRPSFYEQSSIFEPATPAVAEEEVFDFADQKMRHSRTENNGNGQHVYDEPYIQEEPEQEYRDDEDDYIPNVRAHGRFKYKRRQRMRRDGNDPKTQRKQDPNSPTTDDQAQFTKNGFTEKPSRPEYTYDINGTEGYARFARKNVPEESAEFTEDPISGEMVAGTDMPRKNVNIKELSEQLMDQEEIEEKPTKVLDDISDNLEEAWKLSEAQRKKIIKRLLLKWHPDKNIGQEEVATAVTQHIQAEIERLELGLPRPKLAEEFSKDFDFDMRNPFSGSESFRRNFYNAYQFFYEQMNQRAKEHKEQRERYKENLAREYANDGYDFDVPPSFSSSNPQPAQAKRFLKQAQEDLRAADNDYDVREPAYEWVCFKAHQASEKALKAAQFSVDAVASFSHDLASLAATVEDMELRRLALKLQRIIGDSNKLYNPDPVDFVIIPHEEYSKEKACDSIMCAADILERVKEFVESRGE